MEDSVQLEIKKLSKLKQFKNHTEEQLLKLAQYNVVLRELVESGNFLDADEKKLAKTIFENYLSKLDYENYSDLSTLSTLVYSEVLLKRLEKSINKCTDKDGAAYINEKLLKSHSDLSNQVLHLKEKLGINAEDKKDDASYLQLLIKRFQRHIMQNKVEYSTRCGKCGAILLLRQKAKDFDCLLHPNFVGLNYLNLEALQDVEDGKLTKEQYAKFFKVSTDFVDYAIKNKGKYILPEN